MVRGVNKFKEYFADYAGQYVFIGGTACDIILGNANIDFRATKDIDMVLIIEALNEAFVNQFVNFIEDGGYRHIKKGTKEEQFFRFEAPTDRSYPAMIELFSKTPDYLQTIETRLAPVHVSDDVISLSAILLDNEYYDLLVQGAVVIDDVTVLDLDHLILFKMKAWLDLSERKANGEPVDSKNIKKHKNDVLRLAINLEPEQILKLSGQVKWDALNFLDRVIAEPIDVKTLGIRGFSFEDIINRIRTYYLL